MRDPSAFTAFIASRMTAAMPDAKIEIRGPLTLGLPLGADGAVAEANLDRVWDFCLRNNSACERETATLVANTAEWRAATLTAMRQSPTLAMLRVTVRPARYVQELRRVFATGRPDVELIAEPLAGDLWRMCVVDFPTTTRTLTSADLAQLGVSREQANAACVRNVATSLRPLDAVVRRLQGNAIGILEGDDYESSRLALHADWAAIAASMGGELIVAVPGSRVMLYADGRQPNAVDAMATLARRTMEGQPRQISSTVFRWTPNGWRPVSP